MKPVKAHPESETLARDASRICCLTRVNALLKSLRMKHNKSAGQRTTANERSLAADDEDPSAPTARDYFVGELEASVAPESEFARLPVETLIAFDGDREITRAKLVFAATLAIPLLVVAAVLGLYGAQLGRAASGLLEFSTLALATPLILALARTALRAGWQGLRQHPWLAALGAMAAGGYASSALAMSTPAAGTTSALTLSLAGVLVTAVQLGHWWLVRRSAE